MSSDTNTTKFGPDILASDHLRNCQGREYQCSCGYDEAKDNEIVRMRATITHLQNAIRHLIDGYVQSQERWPPDFSKAEHDGT